MWVEGSKHYVGESITSKTTGGRKYYYFHKTYRTKVNPSQKGKTRGSGKSKVITEEVYLGTAETILRKIKENQRPLKAKSKFFGLECAALSIIDELEIIQTIDKHVPKRNQGHSVGEYMGVASINRICGPTSRRGIAGWLDKTVLPEKMRIDPTLMKSKNFWDAFDKVLSEDDIKETSDLLTDDVILAIEEDIWVSLLQQYDVNLDTILYDPTNYTTYFDALNKSELCKYARSKEGQNHLRHLGLALGITEADSLPLFHILYAANHHDAKLFPDALSRLMEQYIRFTKGARRCTLIMDKGNNSKKNIQLAIEAKCIVIGSLVLSHHLDLIKKRLPSYKETVDGLPVYRTEKEVFGSKCAVAVTFNEKLKARQKRMFEKKLNELEQSITQSLDEACAKDGKTKLELETIIRDLKKESTYGRFLDVKITGRQYKKATVTRIDEKIRLKKLTFGKIITFCTDPEISTEKLVRSYKSKYKIEDIFRLTKKAEIVSFRPPYCWTDSKLRVFAFICVLGLLIWKLICYKVKKANLEMSDQVLKMELADIRQTSLVYSPSQVECLIEEMSTVQSLLFSALRLDRYAPS